MGYERMTGMGTFNWSGLSPSELAETSVFTSRFRQKTSETRPETVVPSITLTNGDPLCRGCEGPSPGTLPTPHIDYRPPPSNWIGHTPPWLLILGTGLIVGGAFWLLKR